jgi:predicted nucleic acid-binding protein
MTSTTEQYLLDTGILLRLVNRHDPEHVAVRDAVRSLRRRAAQLVTSYQNLGEFWNVLTRPVTPNRTGYGRSIEEAVRCVRFFRKYTAVIPETTASGELALALMEQCCVIGSKVHDTRLAAIALSTSPTQILTLNASDFRRFSGLSVVTPAEILAARP